MREDPWLPLGPWTISGSCDVLAPEKARTIIDGEAQGRIANKPRSCVEETRRPGARVTSEPAAPSAAICDPISNFASLFFLPQGQGYQVYFVIAAQTDSLAARIAPRLHRYSTSTHTTHTHTLGLIDRRHNRHRPLHLQLDRIALISACLSAATALTLMLAGKPP